MGLLNLIPVVGPALDALSGIASASQARSAFKSRYQDTVRDLKKAGLNPALAYGQGGGSPQTSDIPDIGTSAVRAYSSSAEAKQRAASTDLTSASSALLKAQSLDLIDQVKTRNKLLESQTLTTQAHGQKTGAEWRLLTGTMEERKAIVRQQLKNAIAQGQLTSAHAGQIGVQKRLLELSVPEAQAEAEFFGGQWGQYQPYINSAGGIARSLGAFWPRFNIGGDKTFNTSRRR